MYEREERQRLIDFAEQFDGILAREFSLVDAAGALRTPPEHNVLHGITRRFVMEDIAPALGYAIEERLFQLFTHVRNMISVFSPDAVAVEEPFIGRGERQFIGPAIAVGQAQALVLIGAASSGIPVHRYSPAEVKSAVSGNGRADKAEVATMVRLILSLRGRASADATDALAVAICCAQRYRFERLTSS